MSPADKRKQRVTRRGVVVKESGDKTLAVHVERMVIHPLYKKRMRRRTKLLVHDEKKKAKLGDEVEIMECRPISKHKNWRLVKVLGHGREPVVGEEELAGNDPGSEPTKRS